MKKLVLIAYSILISFFTYGQDITGKWNGVLTIQETQFRVIFKVTKTKNGFRTTMDSPDQKAKDIPVTNTIFENPKIKFEISNLHIEYEGEFRDKEIVGTFKQNGFEFPMNLSRRSNAKKVVHRPQEPKKPYPYHSEDVTFENPIDAITLSGTLTLPSQHGKYPAVVMITGSGPQNRNEELLGHKPFLVISDYLTRNGIAVLRFDDRGTAQSTGDHSTATSADFATDVKNAVEYLKGRKEIDTDKIGLIGHSEGGLITSMVASESEDISFIVQLAGPGIPGYDILILQTELMAKANGIDSSSVETQLKLLKGCLDIILQGDHLNEIKLTLKRFVRKELEKNPEVVPVGFTIENFVDSTVNSLATPWFKYFLKYDPASSLKKVKCPVLAINGQKDLQVPSKINLKAIEKNLKEGGNKNVTIKELPNLNHLFQECLTGSPIEYGKIEQTISPIALKVILDWITIQIE